MGASVKPAAAEQDRALLAELPAQCASCGADASLCRLNLSSSPVGVPGACCGKCRCDVPRFSDEQQPSFETIAVELASLRSALSAMARVQITSLRPAAPDPPRQSLPVRAAVAGAKGGYRLTKGAAAVLGLLAAIAEVVAPDHAVLRAIFRALFEAAQ